MQRLSCIMLGLWPWTEERENQDGQGVNITETPSQYTRSREDLVLRGSGEGQ